MAHADDRGGRTQPSREEIRAELDAVLGGETFEHAGRAREFLRFVVEETLAGRDDRLKGYTVALDVFERAEDFDAATDPLVRVEAGRLRRRLLEHYQGPGRDSAVRIDLPRGAYVPRFSYAQGAAPRAAETPRQAGSEIARPLMAEPSLTGPPSSKSPARWRHALPAAALLGLVVLATCATLLLRDLLAGASAHAPRAIAADIAGPKLLVLPFANLSNDRELDYFAFGMTEEVIVRLGSFSLVVLADTTRVGTRDENPDLAALRSQFAANYVLTGSVRHAGGAVRVGARLVDASSGAQLWAEAFDADLDVDELVAIEERLAARVASAIGVPYGPLFEREIALTGTKSPEQLSTYDCVLRFYYYAARPNVSRHGEAARCFETAVKAEPQSADAWAGLSMTALAEHAYGYNRMPGDPIERARDAARKALAIDGDSRLANRAMLNVRFATRDLEGLDTAAERMVALAPNDPSILGLAGTLLSFAGQRDRGMALLDRAVALTADPPAWFYLPRVFAEIDNGDYDDALDSALAMDAPSWFTVPMMVAASAGLAGRDDVAERAVRQLLELYPEFPAHAREELAKWYVSTELVETTVRGLRAAGLEVP